jgi:hypothetical protein
MAAPSFDLKTLVRKPVFVGKALSALVALEESKVVVQCFCCSSLCESANAFIAHFAKEHLHRMVSFSEVTNCTVCNAKQHPNTMGLHYFVFHGAQVLSLLLCEVVDVSTAVSALATKREEAGWLMEEFTRILGVCESVDTSATAKASVKVANSKKRVRTNDDSVSPDGSSPQQAVRVSASKDFDTLMKAVKTLTRTNNFNPTAFDSFRTGNRDQFDAERATLTESQEQVAKLIEEVNLKLSQTDGSSDSASTSSCDGDDASLNQQLAELREQKINIDGRLKTLRKDEESALAAYKVVASALTTVEAVKTLFETEEQYLADQFAEVYSALQDVKKIKKSISKVPKHTSAKDVPTVDNVFEAFEVYAERHKTMRDDIKMKAAKSRIDALSKMATTLPESDSEDEFSS